MPRNQHAVVVRLGGIAEDALANLSALDVALDAEGELNANVHRFELHTLDLPPVCSWDAPAAVRKTSTSIPVFEADGLIWTARYTTAPSAVRSRMRSTWLELLAKRDPPYLTDKVVGLISSAGGVQGLRAVNTMEYVARSLRAFAIPLVVPITASTAFRRALRFR